MKGQHEQNNIMIPINYFNLIRAIISFAVALLFAVAISSCNTVHKTTQSEKIKTDSVHVVKNEAAEVSKKDSAGSKSETGNYEKETVYQYDTVYEAGKVVYVPRIIKVYEKGNYVASETASKSNYDSIASKQIDSSFKHQQVEVKNTEKKSMRMPVALIIGGVVLLAVVFCAWYFGRKFDV